MPEGILSIQINVDARRAQIEVPLKTSSYVDIFEGQGFGYIKLAGLGWLAAKDANGALIDEISLPTDPDAQFLLDHYKVLEEVAASGRTNEVWTYLADGCFEFNAVIVGDTVHVRVGIMRGKAFKAPFDDGVTIDLAGYLAIWRGIAEDLLRAAHGPAQI
jgi:hypothetical protein